MSSSHPLRRSARLATKNTPAGVPTINGIYKSWVDFCYRVREIMSIVYMNATIVHAVNFSNFLCCKDVNKTYDEWTDEQILTALDEWIPPARV